LKHVYSVSSLDSITDNSSETDCSGIDNRKTNMDIATIDRIALASITKDIVTVFSIASQLLVDLSALPIPCDSKQNTRNSVPGTLCT
jgi:hypothetical protein